MARYARLASHVFSSFEEFMDWIVIQQFDIAAKPERAPILKAGQRVTIKDAKSVYVVTRHIENAASIFVANPKGGFHPRLIDGQGFLFSVREPVKSRVDINTVGASGTSDLYLDEVYATQNNVVTLRFNTQDENFNKFSSVHVLDDGNVNINTGVFNVDAWTGSGNTKYKPGRIINLTKNSSYLLVMRNAELVYLVETGRSSFAISQNVPDSPEDASTTIAPSEKAVSKGLFDLSVKLSEAIEASAGFLKYAGIDPETNLVTEVTDGNHASDIAYVADVESELSIPSMPNLYALVLKDTSSVKVFKSFARVSPTYSVNTKYLGEGKFGLTNVSTAIAAQYPRAKASDIVSNLDTVTEWEFDSFMWRETIRPAGDSRYLFNSEYLGVYSFRKTPSIMGRTIDMVFPTSPVGGIVNNTSTNTEWKKTSTVWSDTGRPIGSTNLVPNPKISGVFAWNSNDADIVKAALAFRYGSTSEDGKIVLVTGGTEWMYVVGSPSSWVDTGNPGGTSIDIPNVKYLGEGNYGSGTGAANNIMLAYPNAVEGSYVGNEGTKTDWRFDGVAWANSNEALGLNKVISNPLYGGTYTFDADNYGEVAASIKGKYPVAPSGNIVYNTDTLTEWAKSREGEWMNTFSPIYTTPQLAPDPMLLGTFNYLDYWIPPAETLRTLFPDARYTSFVCNTSTGTEWELSSEELAWVNTGRPIGTSPTSGNSKYLGTAAYRTNPPTDEFILHLVFPKAKETQFATNITTNTHWDLIRGRWVNTKALDRNKWLLDQAGVYEWENKVVSGIKPGYMFHLTTRHPNTEKSEVFWFANTWNILDFDSKAIGHFTDNSPGVILGKKAFGYVTAESDVDGNSIGRVHGLTAEGTGANFLNDAGEYVEVATVKTLPEDTDIYLDFDNGNDLDDGFSRAHAWKTSSKVQLYLASIRPIYKYIPGSGKIPTKVTLHLVGNGTAQDLIIENSPYLNLVGNTSATPVCRRLHVVNSTVSIKDMLLQEKIILWKSGMQITGPATCQGLELTDSTLEQFAKVTIPSADSSIPVIHIDETSSFYHGAVIASKAALNNTVTFLNILGTYIKASGGSFERPTEGSLRGIKVAVGPQGEIIGTDLGWLYSAIPYAGFASANLATPVSVPAIRTLFSTDSATGYQIADGTDLADLIRNAGGILIRATYNEALTTIPVADRYLGMMVYIQQLKGLYHFRDGILNKDLTAYIVPHYNITHVINPCCVDEWANQFPYQFVDDDNFLVGEDLTFKDPVQSYVLSDKLDWNTHTDPGHFYIRSVKDQSIGAPASITAWWWLDVGTHMYNKTQLKVIQCAKRHDNTGNVLTRILENSVWGSWTYNYAQYSG